MAIDLSTALPPVLVFMIYASLACIFLINDFIVCDNFNVNTDVFDYVQDVRSAQKQSFFQSFSVITDDIISHSD